MAGLVSAAATAGVLLGLGRARGATFDLLNDTAHLVLGERARLVAAAHVPITPLAMLVHLVSMLLWGVVFALISARARGWRLLVFAALFAAAVLALDIYLLPASLRPGFETAMGLPELVLLYTVMAAALAFGLHESRRAAVA